MNSSLFREAYDFISDEFDFCFTKRNLELTQSISFGQSAEYNNHACYSPYFIIKCDAVQDVKKQLFSSNDHILDSTLIQHFGQISQRYSSKAYIDFTQYVMRPEDKNVFQIKVDFTNFLDILGHNFIRDTSTLSGISNYLNSQILKIDFNGLTREDNIKLIRQTGGDWAVSGLIAAKLTRDENLQELIKRYKKIFFPNHIQGYLNRLLNYFEMNTET